MPEADQRVLQTPVLVLNATYEPINVTAARRAVVLVLKGVATTEEENGGFVHSARMAIRVPSRHPADGISSHSLPDAARSRGRIFFCATATPASSVGASCPR